MSDYESNFSVPTQQSVDVQDIPPQANKTSNNGNEKFVDLFKYALETLFNKPIGGRILLFYRKNNGIFWNNIPYGVLYFFCMLIDIIMGIIYILFTTFLLFIVLLIIVKFFDLIDTFKNIF